MVYYLIIAASSAVFCFSLTTFFKGPFFKIATSSTSQLNIILDKSLEESAKDKQLLKNLTKLLKHLFSGLAILLIVIAGAVLIPVIYLQLNGESEADTSSVYFYASVMVGSLSLLAYRKKGNYSYWSKLLHTILLDNYAIGKYLFERELKKYKPKVSIGDQDFLIVTGLARSGTTALTNLIFEEKSFHSIRYSNVPFLLSPNLWKKIYQPQGAKQQERAHGDKMFFSQISIEALEEYFFKAHLKDSYIHDNYLEKHQIGEELSLKYYQYQNLFRVNKNTTYLAKNNNFLLRYESLRKLNKRFNVILVFRNPIDQAQSLLNQHKNFAAQQQNDDFVLHYMNWLGHYEFGLNHKYFDLFETSAHEVRINKNELSFWLKIWINYYSYVTIIYKPDQKLFLVHYEDIANNPDGLKRVIATNIGLELGTEQEEAFGLKKPAEEDLMGVDDELIKQANRVYEKLLSLKLEVI